MIQDKILSITSIEPYIVELEASLKIRDSLVVREKAQKDLKVLDKTSETFLVKNIYMKDSKRKIGPVAQLGVAL
jgi:hypothetical protein